MPATKETYKDKEFVYDEEAGKPRLSVDGLEIIVHRDNDIKEPRYSTPGDPYRVYSSLSEMARAIIDSSENS